LGVYIHSEVHTKDGRADAIIDIAEGVFCLEFKLDKTAKSALEQIKTKGYLDKYASSGKPKYAIGINFNSLEKKVEEIIWEEIR
jgi:PD-(D/E)XK nuclease superfamily